MRRTEIQLASYALMACLLVLLTGCGKKGAPTLKAYEKPEIVKDIKISHRDGLINIEWAYGQQPNIKLSGFYVERAEAKGYFVRLATLPADARKYGDATFSLNREYRYRMLPFSEKEVIGEASAEIQVLAIAVPAAPAGLKFRADVDAIEITWDRGPADVKYNVYRSAEKGTYPSPVNEKPIEANTYRDSLNLAKKMYYVVVAVKETSIINESQLSDEIVVDPAEFVPETPADVRFVKSEDKGYLSWQDNREVWVKGYRIYRKAVGSNFISIAETRVPLFVDEEMPDGEVAYYVAAIGPVKESRPSATVFHQQKGDAR